jgi:xylan 1,4-beta-xylosidase
MVVMMAVMFTIAGNPASAYTSDLGNGQFQNPIQYADDADPSVIKVGDYYYMSNTSFQLMPGIPIKRSTDLVNWEIVSYAYDRIDVGMDGIDQAHADAYNLVGNKNVYGQGSWATSLKYNNGKFYVVFSSLDLGATFVMTRNSPMDWGGWTFAKIQGLGYAHDPELFFDNDKVYLIYGNCYVTELNADVQSVKSDGVNQRIFIGESSQDGNRIFKKNGYYYVLTTPTKTSDTYIRIQKAWRSTSLTGPYEQKVILDDPPNHQAVIIEDGSHNWAMMFADYGAVGRVPMLSPVSWIDNWPILGVAGKVPDVYTKPAPGNGIKSLGSTDEFTSSPYIQSQWQWNHNPDNAKWTLSERPGWMRLKTSQASDLYYAKNTLTQRSQGPLSTGWIKLDTTNMKDGQIAGLSAFQAKYGYIGVRNTGGAKKLVAYNVDGAPETSVSLANDLVYLKLDFDFTTETAKFFYSYDESNWTQLGNSLAMEYFYSNAVNGNGIWYLGYRFALFNYTTGTDTSGYADFDFFRFSALPSTNTSTSLVSGATYKLENKGSGKVIDIPWGQDVNGVQLQQWSDLGGTAQQWIVTDTGDGQYRLQSVSATNKVMDVRNGLTGNGEAIQLMTDFGNTAQRFAIHDLGNGYWSIVNVNSNKALDIANSSVIDGGVLIQNEYTGTSSQQWKFIRVN